MTSTFKHSWRRLTACLTSYRLASRLAAGLAVAAVGGSAADAETLGAARFHHEVQPVLEEFCYDCHGDGARKGKISFDELKSDEALLDPNLWLKVLKNVRAGLMPPEKETPLTPDARLKLEHWIKQDAFGIRPDDPDPGRVTVRRLNRVEYRNTIRDLMGIDFNAEVEFPPDDTGYGFDNIGDVLTVSPMLLEKYLAAAQAIVTEAVPTVAKEIPEKTIAGSRFRRTDSKPRRDEGRENRREGMLPLSYYEPAVVANSLTVDRGGSYRVTLELAVKGNFEFDPGRCVAVFKLGDRELLRKEFGWYDYKNFHFEFDEKWEPGEQRMTVELEPLSPVEKKINSLEMNIAQVTVRGPMEKESWAEPKNYRRFFPRDVPETSEERRVYARELLEDFASKAFRRKVDENTVARLASVAEGVYSQSDKTFEAGIAHALVAILASPRFLFRLEEADSAASVGTTASVDEYSLASRLSYFLWSTMPDEELFRLAEAGELRKNLHSQVARMLADPRAEKLTQNFVGQWLQTRDIEGISINARAVLARDSGEERQLREKRDVFRAQQAQRIAGLATLKDFIGPPAPPVERPIKFSQPRVELDRDLREAMRRETEMFFATILQEDRPAIELIDSDFTFLNEKLAKLYDIPGVKGSEMRRVTLPPDSPRGGVLTQGSTLVVTSNPDRTSPVKRGLYILENLLGTPTPPPPPDVPALEVGEKEIADHEPTLREALKVHRDKPLCASCHNRMDPIGLAFENFNAMGMWREKERNQDIDPAGQLITGEKFTGVRELKHILANDHRVEFYRCLTEKLLTYALGRGLEYYDTETVDKIVQQLERENGRFSALLTGVIESVPFQKMRMPATVTASVSEN